ncbi:hypothetical protein Drose_04140 [Dactylosporangium roseum]|uniref:Uncharacterized protein n=1 Tax=Dactylosporangium roseum TaxID=47989 RepID=A0ABY5Z609_9ACTN|nr:hypothetical protein [Dactylosporangium roseum]UWZ37479.1 hypothetical protein Drose_04140 [Dactylosporangium roseum]
MGVITMDGRVAVGFATSIATIALPTVTELTTGSTRLETFITPDGLEITPTTGEVDVSNLGSVANASRAGRIKWAIKITFHHDGPTDTPWNLLPYRTNGFLWVRRMIDRTTAIASGQKLAVYAVEAGEPDEDDPKPDGVFDFTSDFFVTELGYNSRSVVA